ncbi:unnamed protein product, partial [Larinioides sclopetarius]
MFLVNFQVVALRCRINEEISTFEAGFFMITASYILNIEYAEMACVTLEFIQRCFLSMNPDKGSKASKRKKSAMNQKVLTLLNKL